MGALAFASQALLADEPISAQELLSVYALMAHIAHNQGVRQELIQIMVEAEFSVEHVSNIPQREFQDVMNFLMDLRMEDTRSKK